MRLSDLTLVELPTASDELLADTAAALDHPELTRWLATSPQDALVARRERDLRGESLHLLLVHRARPLGWAGWLRYPPTPSWVETTTFLAPSAWGTGLLDQLAALQWQVAAEAGCTLIASIHRDNLRSIAAHRRCWPDAEMWEECFEPHRPRHAWRLHAHSPPVGYEPLEHPALASWVAALAQIPLRPG